jgi:FAS-associated factor 2
MASPGEVDIGQLSPSQQEALQQYTAVTNQEVSAAIPILQRAQWNVQVCDFEDVRFRSSTNSTQLAISRFFDGDTGDSDPLAEAIAAAQNAGPTRTSMQENLQESLLRGTPNARTRRPDAAPRIVPQPEGQVIHRPGLLLSILFTPFNLLYKLLSASLGLFAYLFPFLPRLFKPRAGGPRRNNNTTGRRMLAPKDTAARFKREFEEEHGPNTLPFYENGYAQALDLAKKELKFLLVVLVSPEHDDTSSFIRDTLLSPEVQAFLNDPANNIILWAGNVQDSEAYQVSTALRCTKFPFGCLISHTNQNGPSTMSIVARLAGPMPAGTYLAKLQNAITTYSAQLNEARSARVAQQMERNIRNEQDSAYERSLARDRELARQRREAEAAAVAAERETREKAAAAEKYTANLAQWKQWRSQRIAPEPEAGVKDVVRLGITMPKSAERVTRRFASTASMEELFAFVECYNILKEGEASAPVEKPAGFAHEYKLRLVSRMPRKVHEPDEEGTILERVGRGENLMVELTDDDDDEEEGEEGEE